MANTPGTLLFPTALDDADSLIRVANQAATTLTALVVDGTDATITVASTSAFPATGVVSIDNEAIYYASKTSTTFTGLTRGADGTTAAGHANGRTVQARITARQHSIHTDALVAVQTKLGYGSSTPTASTFLKGTGAGTSGWSALASGDVTTALGYTPINPASATSYAGSLTGIQRDKGGAVYNVMAYGATGDSGYDAAAAVTGTAVTTAQNTFKTDGTDVGRTVMIAGAGTSGGSFYGTIASVTDAKTATLSGAVTTNVTARTLVVYRTDDSAAFSSAINAASSVYGGKIIIPPGVYNATVTLSDVTRRLYMRLEGSGPSSVIVPSQNKIGVYCFALQEVQVADLKIVGGQCGIWIDSNLRGRIQNIYLWDQVFGSTSPAPPWDGDGIFVDGDASTELTFSDIAAARCMGIGLHYWRGTTQDNGGLYLHNVTAITSSLAGKNGVKIQGQGGGKGYSASGTGLSGTITPHPRDTSAVGMTLTYNTDGNGAVTSFTVAGGTGYTRPPFLNFGTSYTVQASLRPYSGSAGSSVPVFPTSGGYGAGSTYSVVTNTSGCFTFGTNIVCDGYSDQLTPPSGPAMAIQNAANVRMVDLWSTGPVAGTGALWLNNVAQSKFVNVWSQNGNATDTTASHIRIENTSHDLIFSNVFFPKSCAYSISFDGTAYNVALGSYVSDLEQRTSPSNGLLTNDFTQLVHQAGSGSFLRFTPPPAVVTSTAEGAYGALVFYDANPGGNPQKKYLRMNAGKLELLSDNLTSLATLDDSGNWTGPLYDKGGAVYNVKAFGARGDSVETTDGAMTSASPTLTCAASAPFVLADVGRNVLVVAAGTGAANLYTTISGYISATQVTLSASAGATVSSTTVVVYRTDDSAAFVSAVNACSNGGVVYVPAGVYWTSVNIPSKNDVSLLGTGKASVIAPKTGVGVNITSSIRCDVRDLRIVGGNTGIRINADLRARLSNLHVEGQRKSASAVTVSTITVTGAGPYTALVTTATPHGLAVGDWTTIAGSTPTTYNGVWQVATAPTTTTFTYSLTANPAGNATVVGTSLGPYDDGAGIFINGDGSTELQFEGIYVAQTESHGVWYDRPSSTSGADSGGVYFRGVIVARQNAANTLTGNGFRINSPAGSAASDYLWFTQCIADGFNDVCWYINNIGNIRANSIWAVTGTTGVATKGALQITASTQASFNQAWIQNKSATGYGLELANACTQLTFDDLEIVGVSGGIGIQFTGTACTNLQFGTWTAEGGITALGSSLQAANAQSYANSMPTIAGYMQPPMVLVNGSGGAGAAFGLQDTTPSASTPKKYFRVASGVLQVLSDGFSVLAQLNESGRFQATEFGIAGSGGTPNKYWRVNNSNLQLLNSAYQGTLFGVTEAGMVGIGPNVSAITTQTYGLHQFGGGYRLQALTPTAPTNAVVNAGAASTGYWYWTVAEDAAGNKSQPSATAFNVTTGPPTIGAVNSITVTFSLIAGAAKTYVLRTTSATAPSGTSNVLVGTVTALFPNTNVTVTDVSAAGSSFTIPARSVTGDATIDGIITLGSAGYLAHTGVAGNPGTLVDGQAWYNTTQLSHRFQEKAGTAGLVGLLKAQTSIQGGDTITSTTSITNFATNYAIPAGGINVAGKSLRLIASGVFTTSTSPGNQVFTLRLGTIALGTITIPATASLTAQPWRVQFEVTVITASSGTNGVTETGGLAWIATSTTAGNTLVGKADATVGSIALESAQTLQLAVTPGATTVSMKMRQLLVEVLD